MLARLSNFNILLKSLTQVRSISHVPVALCKDGIRTPSDLESSHELESPDDMLQRIKAASDSIELLDVMSAVTRKDVEPRHISNALNQLYELQKTGMNSISSQRLLKHRGFGNLCHMLKSDAPRMEPNDVIICLKVLTYFGIKSDSIFIHRLLILVKDQINDLSLNNLIFLGFLLKRLNKTPLTEALKIAIPVVFELNLGLKLDHNNVLELSELMHFVTSSSIRISNKSMTSIVTALTLHGEALQLHEARSVIWSFTAMRRLDPAHEKLFMNCMKVINKNFMKLSFDELETTLEKLIQKLQEGVYDGSLLFDFFDNSAKYVIDNDLGYLQASYILRKFNKINYVSFDLLDYVDRVIIGNHSILSSCRATGLIIFAAAFSNANYKSENWEILKSLLHENPLMHSERLDLPWLKFAMEMLSLGFHSNILLERVFSTAYLEKTLSRENNYLDYLQLLGLWQGVKLLIPDYSGPLPEQRFINDAMVISLSKPNTSFAKVLADIFGGSEFVQTNVSTRYGHCLDYVVSFDSNENPIAMPCKIRTFDELPKSQVRSLAIFFLGRNFFPLNFPEKMRGTFDLKLRTLDEMNITTVNMPIHLWLNLPESERYSYVEREIRYTLRHGMKCSETE